VTVVSHAQLHVLKDIVILVMVAVCGAVIQTTVYMIYVILPPVIGKQSQTMLFLRPVFIINHNIIVVQVRYIIIETK
jgi:hypothetical protein